MANSSERTLVQEIGSWVQIVAIIAAGGLGYYEFVFKEKTVPNSAPINVSVNLELKKLGTTFDRRDIRGKPSIDVEMQVSMRNPSTRKIDLLPSAWIAWGYRVQPRRNVDDIRFAEIGTNALRSGNGRYYVEREFLKTLGAVVSTGQLFEDNVLKPGETVSRTIILHVPLFEYDMYEVLCEVPSAADASRLRVLWGVDSTGALFDSVCVVDKKGNVRPTTPREDSLFMLPPVELQESVSSSEISLR